MRSESSSSGSSSKSIVHISKSKTYRAEVKRGGKQVHLGLFATAEEAALCVARASEAHVCTPRHNSKPH